MRIAIASSCSIAVWIIRSWPICGRPRAVRARGFALVRYLEHRVRTGHFRSIPNVRLAARLVIETCATWAVHIHWDRAPENFDVRESREIMIDFLVRGLLR